MPGSSGASGGGTRPVGRLIELTGTYEASGADRSPTPFVPGSKVTLRVLDRTISVSAGCNTISGPAHVEDSRLVLDEGVGMTEMGCEKRLMDQDAWLADHLSKRPRLDRSGRQLSLVWDDARLDLIWAAEQILPGDPPGGLDEPISTSLTTEPGPS